MVNGHVLVLNRSWVAVNLTPVKRALCLLYQGTARAVHPSDYSLYDFHQWCDMGGADRQARYVQTPKMRVPIPEVVVLSHFNAFINRKVTLTRHNIFERDKHTCQYCGCRLPRSVLTIDHVVPNSRGGKNTWENLVLACSKCNVKKADRTPREANMPLLRSPIKPSGLPRLGTRMPTTKLASWRKFLNDTYWDFGDTEASG